MRQLEAAPHAFFSGRQLGGARRLSGMRQLFSLESSTHACPDSSPRALLVEADTAGICSPKQCKQQQEGEGGGSVARRGKASLPGCWALPRASWPLHTHNPPPWPCTSQSLQQAVAQAARGTEWDRLSAAVQWQLRKGGGGGMHRQAGGQGRQPGRAGSRAGRAEQGRPAPG